MNNWVALSWTGSCIATIWSYIFSCQLALATTTLHPGFFVSIYSIRSLSEDILLIFVLVGSKARHENEYFFRNFLCISHETPVPKIIMSSQIPCIYKLVIQNGNHYIPTALLEQTNAAVHWIVENFVMPPAWQNGVLLFLIL
jgi:hypothetical protein